MDLTNLEGASDVKKKRFAYCNADCFLIAVSIWMKSAQAIDYDIAVLKEACKYIMINGADRVFCKGLEIEIMQVETLPMRLIFL